MGIRQPIRAGSFYEGETSSCRQHAADLLAAADPPAGLPARLYGGLVPHAGWVYSGRLAAMTFKALAAADPLGAVVLLGADHTGAVRMGEVYATGAWRTPIGESAVDEALAAALLDASDLLRANPDAHRMEHSLEVQVPLLQTLAPAAKIVPIAVPPTADAPAIGEAVGKVLSEHAPTARIVGSTDLTHHGGHFGSPFGHGAAGEAYSRGNDRRMLDLIEAMDAAAIVPEALARHNACGAGAIAAAIAACRQLGATAGRLLEYTNSYVITHEMMPAAADDTTVGYASVVFM